MLLNLIVQPKYTLAHIAYKLGIFFTRPPPAKQSLAESSQSPCRKSHRQLWHNILYIPDRGSSVKARKASALLVAQANGNNFTNGGTWLRFTMVLPSEWPPRVGDFFSLPARASRRG